MLGIECYICNEKGHLFTNCQRFTDIKGNLSQDLIKKMQIESASKTLPTPHKEMGHVFKDYLAGGEGDP